MVDSWEGRRRKVRFGLVLAGLAALALVTFASGGASAPAGAGNGSDPGFQGENAAYPDFDARSGRKAPTAAQERLVPRGAAVRWNDLGTPHALLKHGGFLAAGLTRDDARAARDWLAANRGLFGLSAGAVASLELVSSAPVGEGSAVLLRQRFGGLPARLGGLVAVGVVDGKVAFVSSSLSTDDSLAGPATQSAQAAYVKATRNVGRGVDASGISNVRRDGSWTVMDVAGFDEPQRARLVAVPTPRNGVRAAWETLVLDADEAFAFSHFVDARTGELLARESVVDYLEENPTWIVFPNTPPMDYSSTDTRELWCWSAAPGCERVVGNTAATLQWDIDPNQGVSTQTTRGNAARGTENWNTNNPDKMGHNYATPSPTRDYAYAWTNQWFEESCNPNTTFTSAQRNNIDAAAANLFAMHNRMHDWSYRLGFTEAAFNMQERNFGRGGKEHDPEHGNVQAGGISGGPPTFAARDNANQITPADGLQPITNMYLWQPIAAGFYAPCVDGDFDMSVIGHEYTHAISNRMVAGPDERLRGAQANAMGESWSDLMAVEYLQEYGFAPVAGENPFAVGPYVTGDPETGIRNYAMNRSPLNYSNVAYDLVGQQVHADGEIWSATNYDIRQAMITRHGAGNSALQEACAEGQVAVGACPGNRRWTQLVFDAWLLMAVGEVSMVDARDAMLAADVMRFGGANQDLLWNVFASRGLGENASSNGTGDAQPVPSFESPFANEATATFQPTDEDGDPIVAQLFVGDYEARTTPVADTDPATALDDTFGVVPGTYRLLARANGYGTMRLTATAAAGQALALEVPMSPNLASSANGATASGNGINLARLIDDTEATNWASLGSPVAGKQVTVRLAPGGSPHTIDRVQVSAMLRPAISNDPGGDTGGQSRYSALRQFQILACHARGPVNCSQDRDFRLVFTSPSNAFPSVAPRPRAPELIMRSFDVQQTAATHVRLRVLTNQCTGTPDYAGEQDADPRAITDCAAGSSQDLNVRAAELQVFGS
jgi:hypothetical protein